MRASSRHLPVAMACLLLTAACSPSPDDGAGGDDFWLDETFSDRSLAWVDKQNAATLAKLGGKDALAPLVAEAAAVLTDPARLPDVRLVGDLALDYRQGRDTPLGIWRAASRESYFAGTPDWKTLIDFDALSAAEDRKWIFNSASCRGTRCLVSMSDNGKDAHEVREFDLVSRTFVADGFRLPEGKTRSWWYDDDRLLVAPVLGPDSVNESGLPRTIRLWRRGTPPETAPTLFSGEVSDASLAAAFVGAGGRESFVAIRSVSFFDREYWLVDIKGQADALRLPLPAALDIETVFDGRLLLRPNEDWTVDDESFTAGTLLGISLDGLLDRQAIEAAERLYVPSAREAVRDVVALDGRLFVNLIRDYRSAVIELARVPDGATWQARTLDLPEDGFISILGGHEGLLHLRIESPLTPERLVLADPDSSEETVLFARPPAFDSAGLAAELLTTRSRDGNEIAYTLIRAADRPQEGGQPTLVYGYGGFDIVITPRYEPIFGKLWLEKGGAYVHAYLRGGGENGPDWHRSAMLEHRQLPYDDMIAILEDLQRRGVATPEQTGIMGRSNGGLMVAAVMTQRPDLFNAVIVGGPLIDMLHYQDLAPGASWAAEYGDPRRPADAQWIARYSPLQAIRADARYPVPLIITSTDDDRVLPGHARRFAERLHRTGHEALYFEDGQGGHYWELAGGPAPGDWRLRARARAVEFTYLAQQLGLQD